MQNLLKLEEAAQFVAAIVLLDYQPVHLSWWIWIILFFSPDIGMLGYLINPFTGAVTYNLFHHKLVALAFFALGLFWQMPVLTLTGLILLGHSSFDRMLGFGLKFPDAFKHTHLGQL